MSDTALAGGPAHVAPAEHVEMKMKHALAAVRTGIDDEAIPGICNSFQIRDLIAGQHQTSEQHTIRIMKLGNRGEMLSRDDERMYRRLGIDVVERNYQFVFIDEGCGNCFCDDFAKETFAHGVVSFLNPDFPKRVANS